jgi:hypothetical protein
MGIAWTRKRLGGLLFLLFFFSGSDRKVEGDYGGYLPINVVVVRRLD